MLKTIQINNHDLGDGATIDTYGMFENYSVVDMMIDDYNEENGVSLDYDDFEWTYDFKQIVAEIAEARAKELVEDVDCIESIKVLRSGSPEYYNFTTDWFVGEYVIDLDKLEKTISENKEKFEPWYQEHWAITVENSRNDEEKAECLIIAKLDFIINNIVHDNKYVCEEAFNNLCEAVDEIYWNNITMERKTEDVNA